MNDPKDDEIERLERMVTHLMMVQLQAEDASVEIRRLRAALQEVAKWADYHDATGCLQVVKEALGDESR